ncbi:immunity 49 family protein [Streptomyces niveus]
MPLSIMPSHGDHPAGVVRRGDLKHPGRRGQRHRSPARPDRGTELMVKIIYPSLELFRLYLRREEQAFNEAMVTALTWHKEYWTANEARSLSGDGLVALAPLAIACTTGPGRSCPCHPHPTAVPRCNRRYAPADLSRTSRAAPPMLAQLGGRIACAQCGPL